MPYVDGFVVPVPKKSLPAYRRMAQKTGKIWREHGALEFREAVADDVKVGKLAGSKLWSRHRANALLTMARTAPSGARAENYPLALARANSSSTFGRMPWTMRATPCALGCIPSSRVSLSSSATPSRKKG